jgi:hypothetical protein
MLDSKTSLKNKRVTTKQEEIYEETFIHLLDENVQKNIVVCTHQWTFRVFFPSDEFFFK